MKMRNLSTIMAFVKFVNMYGGLKQYWLGEQDWTSDADDRGIIHMALARVPEHAAWVAESQQIIVTTEPCEHEVSVIQWPSGEWVVINPQTSKVHEVQFIGTYGDGWFVQDEGTVERTLVLRRNDSWHTYVTVRGKRIIDVVAKSLEGDEITVGGFNVSSDSNLCFQFEFDEVPLNVRQA